MLFYVLLRSRCSGSCLLLCRVFQSTVPPKYHVRICPIVLHAGKNSGYVSSYFVLSKKSCPMFYNIIANKFSLFIANSLDRIPLANEILSI